MPAECITELERKKIKDAFKSGKLSLANLFQMQSSDRVKALSKYLGKENAKKFTVDFERAIIAPNQLRAMKRVLEKHALGKNKLYKVVSPEVAASLSSKYSMSDFKNMTDAERLKVLQNYFGKKNGEYLNKKYNEHKKKGKLKDWEQKVLNTLDLKEETKLKGSLSKLETLYNMGLLTPSANHNFLETLVEQELGLRVSDAQALEIADKVKKLDKLYDDVQKMLKRGENPFSVLDEKGRFDPAKSLYNQLIIEKALLDEKVISMKSETSWVSITNNLISIFRNHLLGSPKSLANSSMYQVVPTIIAAKRILEGAGDFKQMNSDLETIGIQIDKIQGNKDSNIKLITNYVRSVLYVYDQTGVDMSRMMTLDDGFTIFTQDNNTKNVALFSDAYIRELKKQGKHKEVRDAKKARKEIEKANKQDILKNKKGMDKFKFLLGDAVATYTSFTGLFPKWMAGLTDVTMAATLRINTSIYQANHIANHEVKTGKLSKGMKQQRVNQLITDSLSHNPLTEKGKKIRAEGVRIAQQANYTEANNVTDFVAKLRDSFNVGGVKLGKLISPFLRIATTSNIKGFEAATAPVSAIYHIGMALNTKNDPSLSNVENLMIRRNHINSAVNAVGIWGVTMLIAAAMLDDDDHVPPYHELTEQERVRAYERGALPNSVRINGKWFQLGYFPVISIPLNSFMAMKRAWNPESNVIENVAANVDKYVFSILYTILDYPFIQNIYNVAVSFNRASRDKKLSTLLKAQGLDYDGLRQEAVSRILPAFISRDVWNALNPPDSKYTYLGNEVKPVTMLDQSLYWFGMRKDSTTEIVLEHSRLDRAGFPVIYSEPQQKYLQVLETMMPEKDFIEYKNEIKRKVAMEQKELILSDEYKKMTDEKKQKAQNDIRSKYMSGNNEINNQWLVKIKELMTPEEWRKFKKEEKITHPLLR